MPHITVRGIPRNELTLVAEKLKDIVVKESGTQREYVKVFYSPIERIDAANEIAVDVYWMPRSQIICDNVSSALSEYLHGIGYQFVQVSFTEFPGNLFYENGIHY